MTTINWIIVAENTFTLSSCTFDSKYYIPSSNIALKVGIINTIRLVIKDIYGNEFSSNSVIFYLEFTPIGQSTTIHICTYNELTRSFEFYLSPTLAAPTLIKIYETQSVTQIKCSTLKINVLPGAYNPSRFTLTESNPSGV